MSCFGDRLFAQTWIMSTIIYTGTSVSVSKQSRNLEKSSQQQQVEEHGLPLWDLTTPPLRGEPNGTAGSIARSTMAVTIIQWQGEDEDEG